VGIRIPEFENSVGIYRKQKILTDYRKIFCLFLLVGLSPDVPKVECSRTNANKQTLTHFPLSRVKYIDKID
jgi:hypothetical protein